MIARVFPNVRQLSRALALVALTLAASCAARIAQHTAQPLSPLPWPTDSLRTQSIVDGVTHHFLYSPTGPWAIHVLDIDLTRCNVVVPVKNLSTEPRSAIGRTKTSASLADLGTHARVVGGVNADFFALTPPFGVPVGALIIDGTLIAGPGAQPVLAFDAVGTPHIETLTVHGTLSIGTQRFPIASWNRAAPGGIAFFDAHYASTTDTASRTIEIALDGQTTARVIDVDTLTAGVAIPARGGVLVVGARAPRAVRQAIAALHPGDAVSVSLSLAPYQPHNAVGGRPWLLRDGVSNPAIDSGLPTSFNIGRNPRTAAGISADGHRLILAVVDGRQKPYSDGMSLPELAALMRALGARDAINLDGGGSTTLVYADPDSGGALRVANRPSDKGGERAVGDALAVVHRCSAAPH